MTAWPGDFVRLQETYPHLAGFLLCLAKSALMIGLAWIIACILWNRSATARNWIWRGALVGLLGLIFWEFGPANLTAFHPTWRVAVTPVGEGINRTAFETLSPVALNRKEEKSAQAHRGETQVLRTVDLSETLDRRLPMLWGLGSVMLVLWWGTRMGAGLWWLKRTAVPVSALLLESSRRIATKRKSARLPRMVVGRELATPLLVGWIAPTVYLPEESSRWSDRKIEAVLLHEWSHWQRGDEWWQVLADLTICVWWWNPLVWLAVRQLKAEAEQAADDQVVLSQKEAPDYAQALIEIAGASPVRTLPTGIAMVGRSSLETRIRSILRDNPWRGKVGSLGIGLAFLLVILSLSLGSLYVSAETTGAGSTEILNIDGTVTDNAGHPIRNAEVRIHDVSLRPGPEYADIHSEAYRLDYAKSTFDSTKVGISDNQGHFSIKNVARRVLFDLVVKANGYGPDFAEAVDPKGSPVQFKLIETKPGEAGGKAIGHVVDSEGHPVAGAQVIHTSYTRGDETLYDNGVGAFVVKEAGTDSDGNFFLPFKPGYEGVGVEIFAKGFARKMVPRLPFNNDPREVKLSRGVTVTGRLMKDGKPLASRQVGIAQTDTLSSTNVGEITATTDQEGLFVLTDIGANDEYEVYGKRDSLGMLGVPERKVIRTGDPGSSASVGDIGVKPGVRVSGRILFSGEKPLPSPGTPAQLQVSRPDTADCQYIDLGVYLKFELMARQGEPLQFYVSMPGWHLSKESDQATASTDPMLLMLVPDEPAASGTVYTHGKTIGPAKH